jgi:polar amino acid transport system permease protein
VEVIIRFAKYLFVGAYPHGPIGGLLLTLVLCSIAGLLSFAVGLIGGLMRTAKNRLIRGIATVYVEVVRGIPFIMVLFWFYFLMPRVLGRPLTEVPTSIYALTFFFGAYATEVVRAGILSVPFGQHEAAASTGLTPVQATLYVILPQALRNMLPSLANLYVSLVKDTSLVYFIGVVELTGAATQVMRRESWAAFQLFACILVVYWIICSLLNLLSDRLERRLLA